MKKLWCEIRLLVCSMIFELALWVAPKDDDEGLYIVNMIHQWAVDSIQTITKKGRCEMLIKELLEEVRAEIAQDKRDHAKAVLKARLLEVAEAEKALGTLKGQLEELLEREVDDVG